MSRIAVVGLFLVGFCCSARAADPVKLPKELAIVPTNALLVASFQVKTILDHPNAKGFREWLANSPPEKELKELIGIKFEEIERLTAVLLPDYKPDARQRRFEPESVFLFTMRKPIDRGAIVKDNQLFGNEEAKEFSKNFKPGDKRPVPSGKADAAHYVGKHGRVLEFVGDRTIALWVAERHERNLETLPRPLELLGTKIETGPLSEGIAMAVEYPVAFAVNVPALKTASERDPPPDEFLPLFKADHVAGYIHLKPNAAEMKLTAKFAGMQWATDGEETAQKLKELIGFSLSEDVNRMKKREGNDSLMANFLALFIRTARESTVKRAGNDVVVQAKLDLGAETQALFAKLPVAVTESAGRVTSGNNLKQIGLAVHTYHDTNNALPANTFDKAGKPLLSWRVQLLPMLEEVELYKQFKFDEPWDSDNNKKLIAKIPAVYKLPGVQPKEMGATYYRSFASAKGAKVNAIMIDGAGRRTFSFITDGLSNTIFCVEAAEPCVWTKPDDLAFDPEGKLPTFAGHFMKDRFQVLLCDGSINSLSTKLKDATLKAYITVNGGEVINDR